MIAETLSEIELLSHNNAPLEDAYLESFGGREDGRSYYRFLYRLARRFQPRISVELGVYAGAGSAHLARGCPDGKVFAVDPTPQDLSNLLLECPNVTWVEGPSTDLWTLSSVEGPIDLLFIDTDHSYSQVKAETILWLPSMAPGGIILYDDITLDQDTQDDRGMARFWEEVKLPKLSLPHLHHSGFGVVLVA